MANITYIKIGNEVYRLHDGNALTSESNLDASKVRGTLPASTYIDTTYENKTAVEGGTDVSLVTTGDKYRWNQGGSGGLQNLIDGSAAGSVRGIGASSESSSYTMGQFAFAEGTDTRASGDFGSHAEGDMTVASGDRSHAEGENTVASGKASHAQNLGTIAAKDNQTAIGKYNIEDTETTEANQKAFIIGNGFYNLDTEEAERSNALTVDWQGNVDIASGAKYKINGIPLSASDVGAQPTLVSGTNIKTVNNQSLLGSGNIDIQSSSDIFYAWTRDDGIHTTTTLSELQQAKEDNKIIVLNGYMIPSVQAIDTNNAYFTCYADDDEDPEVTFYYCNSNSVWSSGYIALQSQLISGTNIKTINNQSILGSGDITVSTVAAQIVRW